ncbi:MAG: hypothetical protein V7754_22700, partial [Halioglobus sp.]
MKKIMLGLLITLASSGAYATPAICKNTEMYKQAFYGPLDVNSIPKGGFQQFPYYRYASMNIDQFVRYGVAPIDASKPMELVTGERFDLTQEFEGDRSYLENLTHTLT